MGGRPTWDFRRGTVAVRVMTEVAAEYDVDLAACLEGSGIGSELLADSTAEIDARQELAVVRNIVSRTGAPVALGAEVGSRFTVTNFGLLGFAILSSPTIGDALRVGLNYLTLSNAFLRIVLEDDGDETRLSFDDREIPEDVRPFLLARDVAAITVVGPALLSTSLTAVMEEVRLDLRDDHAAVLGDLPLPIEVRKGRAATALVLPPTTLARALPQADPQTARMCEEQCAALLQRRHARKGFAEEVRTRLLREPGELPSMEHVSSELHIDARTLRRRLTEEGTSFRTLVEEVRATLAVGLLRTIGLSVEEVSERLGYSEPSSFTHAFTRWYGVPPSRYRSLPADRLTPYRPTGGAPAR